MPAPGCSTVCPRITVVLFAYFSLLSGSHSSFALELYSARARLLRLMLLIHRCLISPHRWILAMVSALLKIFLSYGEGCWCCQILCLLCRLPAPISLFSKSHLSWKHQLQDSWIQPPSLWDSWIFCSGGTGMRNSESNCNGLGCFIVPLAVLNLSETVRIHAIGSPVWQFQEFPQDCRNRHTQKSVWEDFITISPRLNNQWLHTLMKWKPICCGAVCRWCSKEPLRAAVGSNRLGTGVGIRQQGFEPLLCMWSLTKVFSSFGAFLFSSDADGDRD